MYVDVLFLAPSSLFLSLAPPAPVLPSIVLDPEMLVPGHSCWTVCLDIPFLAPSSLFLSFVPPAPLLSSFVLDSEMLMPGCSS